MHGGFPSPEVLGTLSHVLSAASRSERLNDTLRAVLHALAGDLNVPVGAIYVIESEGDQEWLALSAAKGPQEIDVGRARYARGEGLTGTIAATRETVVFRTLDERRTHPSYFGKVQPRGRGRSPVSAQWRFSRRASRSRGDCSRRLKVGYCSHRQLTLMVSSPMQMYTPLKQLQSRSHTSFGAAGIAKTCLLSSISSRVALS